MKSENGNVVLNESEQDRYEELYKCMAGSPRYLSAIQEFYKIKYAFNADFRTVMRLISNREKSLLSGILFYVWFENNQAGRKEACTMTAIADRAAEYQILSANTVKTMLSEFETYGLLKRLMIPGNRKNKVIEVAHFVPEGLRMIHDQSLTLIDHLLGSQRLEHHRNHPNDYLRAHLRVVDYLGRDIEWREPAPGVWLFYSIKYGSWVAEDLMMRLQTEKKDGDFYVIENFNRTITGSKFGLSRSSVQRLFLAAESIGLVKQQGKTLLVSESFVDEFLKSTIREIIAYELAWQGIVQNTQ